MKHLERSCGHAMIANEPDVEVVAEASDGVEVVTLWAEHNALAFPASAMRIPPPVS